MAERIQKPQNKRQSYERLRSQMDLERSSFISHWKQLTDHILVRRGRFFITDVDRGDRRNHHIIDSTATLAARTLRSGMMSGVTSPARPWFRLTTPDPDLADFGPVKEWLHTVTQRMIDVFLRSNIYNALPTVYGDMGTFATGAMSLEEDMEDVIRSFPFAIGTYMIAQDQHLRVNTFFREFRMTVRQVVQKFGQLDNNGAADWSNMSPYIKTAWDRGDTEIWIDICHCVKPNDEHDPRKLESKYKKFISAYYERGTVGQAGYLTDASFDPNVMLREKGYDQFPILAPRWEVTGEDVYGTSCPGMDALGDIKALQVMQKRKAQAIEKMINPPMKGPAALRNQKASILPGDMTYIDERSEQGGFRPVHEINPPINELVQDIQEHQSRIKKSYYEDLFLMMSESDRRDITAREVDERHEEKMLALGPVLEQLNQDLLDPMIDITFNVMFKQRLVPPPPPAIQGIKLKVEYISVMAQAQKLVGLAGVERFMGFVGQIQAIAPDVTDKVDGDKAADIYGDMCSIPPALIRSDEAVAAIRAQKQQAQQAQNMSDMIQKGAGAAKDLSQADLSSDNALSRMIQGGGPQPGAPGAGQLLPPPQGPSK